LSILQVWPEREVLLVLKSENVFADGKNYLESLQQFENEDSGIVAKILFL